MNIALCLWVFRCFILHVVKLDYDWVQMQLQDVSFQLPGFDIGGLQDLHSSCGLLVLFPCVVFGMRKWDLFLVSAQSLYVPGCCKSTQKLQLS